jgi:hypothetical protein
VVDRPLHLGEVSPIEVGLSSFVALPCGGPAPPDVVAVDVGHPIDEEVTELRIVLPGVARGYRPLEVRAVGSGGLKKDPADG